MSLSAALAEIQKKSWWSESTVPRCGMSARNARYAAERDALFAVIAQARRISYEDLREKSGLEPRTIGNYMRRLTDSGRVIVYREKGRKFAEIVRG